ncbi:MAG: hypothetical protein JXB43_08255 [Dehalococcoidia bacterium]|nr:hypothetical protein [Dehalococcoidia bacterium]
MKRDMWYWVLLSGLSILLISAVVACVSAPSSELTAQPPPMEQPEKKPAQFEVSELTIKPDTVVVGYPATVAATVINSGDIAGVYKVSFLIDGQEIESRHITLAPGATEEASFQVTKTTVGNYKLSLGESSAVLDVCDWIRQSIQYDTGLYDPQMMGTYMAGGWGHIVHFTPLAPPFKIQKISISAFTRIENFADLSKRMFTVRIWDEHKMLQLWSSDFPWSLFQGVGGWQDIVVPDIIADGDFHIEVVTNSDPPQNFMAINYEESKGELRSGMSYMGKVYTTEKYAGKDKRWFIRVKGQGPPAVVAQEEEEAASEPEAEMTILSPKLVYEDDFSDAASGLQSASAPEGESYYKDGEYHGVVKKRNWLAWQYNRNAGRFKNFIMEEDVRLVSGPKYSAYGLIFRLQDNDNFYYFQVSEDGRYQVGRFLNHVWSDLHSWTKSVFIETGNTTNHLKVVCKGSQIEVYANGHHLTTVVDDSFTDGYVGGIIYASEPNAHVAFDNLKIYGPD